MSVATFRQAKDTTGCKHAFLVGPQRTIKNVLVGHCDSCSREVAVELGNNGERTGRSWLIEYGRGDELDQARLKKQIADGEGMRNAVDDVLTHENAEALTTEDTHEELP